MTSPFPPLPDRYQQLVDGAIAARPVKIDAEVRAVADSKIGMERDLARVAIGRGDEVAAAEYLRRAAIGEEILRLLELRKAACELFGPDPSKWTSRVFVDGGKELNRIREALGLPRVKIVANEAGRLDVSLVVTQEDDGGAITITGARLDARNPKPPPPPIEVVR